MGWTVTAVIAVATALMGFLTLPYAEQKLPWKDSLRESLRRMMGNPGNLINVALAVFLTECLLMATGVGFLAFGIAWPVLASLLAQIPALPGEERTLKDFFLPQN